MRIKIGYLKKIYENSGALVPATIRSEGSVLLNGITGSGKTTLLWYLLYNYIHAMNESLFLVICDYKYEYTALYDCESYHYDIDDIIHTIDSFYQSFQKAKLEHRVNGQHVLVIDEYMSCIQYIEALSKSDKAYKECYQRMTMEITSLLAMGRSLGYSLVCVVQQASAKLWSSSADRENYINKISMGNLSSIAAREIFDNADTSCIDFRKPVPIGHGFLAVQGNPEPIKEFICPRIMNPEAMQKTIREFLDRQSARPP